jgi:hypothetical protein
MILGFHLTGERVRSRPDVATSMIAVQQNAPTRCCGLGKWNGTQRLHRIFRHPDLLSSRGMFQVDGFVTAQRGFP